jgi:hypothetical protein
MGYSGARGELIHEKNLNLKISCQTPFKGIYCPTIFIWLKVASFDRPLLKVEMRGFLANSARPPSIPREPYRTIMQRIMHSSLTYKCHCVR